LQALEKRVTKIIFANPQIDDNEKSIFDYENFREFITKIDKGLAFVGGPVPNLCGIVFPLKGLSHEMDLAWLLMTYMVSSSPK
jgi:hypothetical protein